MADQHPDWPPICLSLIRVILAGEVSREDIEVARRFMGDLEGHSALLEAARRSEAAAIDRLPKVQRVGAMQQRPAPVQRPSSRSQVPVPPRPSPPAAQDAFW
jgi:hypothetical protein